MEEADARGKKLQATNPADPERWKKLHDAMDEAKDSATGLEGALVHAFGDRVAAAIENYAHLVDGISAKLRSLKDDQPKLLDNGVWDKSIMKRLVDPAGSGQWPFAPKGDEEKPIIEGTKKGIVDGLREWAISRTCDAELFARGYRPMAYHPNGGGGGGARGGFFGNKEYPAVDDPGGGGAGSTEGGGSVGTGFDRTRFVEELKKKPWLKERLFHIGGGENNDPAANLMVMESAMNRAAVRGTSLEQQLRRHRSSGKDEGGYYAGYAPSLSAKQRTMMEDNLAKALAGSNTSDYATDNSSGGLAARETRDDSFQFHKKRNGE
jgi:hypothetical protein